MDLRQYFYKIRKQVEALESDWVVVASLETPDGGKPDVLNEMSKQEAAKLIVEQRVRLATDQEAALYHKTLEVSRGERMGEFAEALAERVAALAAKQINKKGKK